MMYRHRSSYPSMSLISYGKRNRFRANRRSKKYYARRIKLNPKKYPDYKRMEDNWVMESYERSIGI